MSDLWTPDKDERLLAMQAAGHSGTEIGMVLGYSRQAILGRLWRLRQKGLGLPVRKPQRRVDPPVKPKPIAMRYPKEKPVKLTKAQNIGKPPPLAHIVKKPWREAMMEAFEPLPGSTPVRLTDRAGSCAWPVGGEGAETLSCGNMTQLGKTYCQHHHGLAYVQVKPLDMRRYERLGR